MSIVEQILLDIVVGAFPALTPSPSPLKGEGSVRIGDFVDVLITRIKSDVKTIAIPFSALTSDGQGGFIVYTVGTGSIVERKTVKIGTQNETRVEILEGLREGEKVVTSGVLNLQEGDMVIET